ncbi:MAG: hypothetical protein U9Q03_05500 [Patescibacteria group bacterium]|nr:hypothetical protein [Patescibacteria group bacterium]
MLTEQQVGEQVREAFDGICTKHRIAARVAGKSSVRAVFTLAELHTSTSERFASIHENQSAPTIAELREVWVPTILTDCDDAVLLNGVIEVSVAVPTARKAHTR